ncbi:MAG: hypothetical protein ACOC3A_11490 [Thermodesulfobacteriota bacterium]
MSKDKPKSSKTGSLVMVLLVLWLAGLTALVLMYLQKPAAGDLDARVARLEAKANSLVGKVNPPGTKEIDNLKGRIEAMENRTIGLGSGEMQAAAAGNDLSGGCDCGQLRDRIAALESAVDSESGTRTVAGIQTGPAAETEKQKTASETGSGNAAAARAEASKESAGVTKKTAVKTNSKPATRTPPPPFTPVADSNRRRPSADNNSRSYPDYAAGSLQDSNRRYQPIYQGFPDDASSRGLLGSGGGGFR